MRTPLLKRETTIAKNRTSTAAILDQLTLPAAILVGGLLTHANRALKSMLSKTQLDSLPVHQHMQQIVRQALLVRDTLTVTIALGTKNFRCIITPVKDQEETVIVFFEDKSLEAQSEKNNALLYRLSLLFATTKLSPNEKLQVTVDHIIFELPVYNCSIFLFNKMDEKLHSVAWGTDNIETSISGKSTFALGEGIAGMVAAELKPMVIPDVSSDKRFVRKTTASRGLALLCVPMISNNQLFGVICANRKKETTFTDYDVQLFTTIASRLSSLLEAEQTRAEILEQRNKMEAIIEHSVDGILMTDGADRIQIWNPALERLTGIEAHETIGRPMSAIDSLAPLTGKTKREEVTETKIQNRKTGKIIWLGIARSPIRSGKSIAGYVAIIRNISRRKELETARNEFVSTASHELRSPITAIVGYLSMLRRGDAGKIVSSQQLFFVDKAYYNAKRMVDLVEDLLTATRVESGQLRYQIESLNLASVIESVLSDCRFRSTEKKLTITSNQANNALVFADRNGIHQVITNLINNAIQYTPAKGKITISFKQASKEGRPMLVTAVRDTGVGINTAHQHRVFEKFARADNPLSISSGGAGLGLYITRSIISHLGGKIWFENNKVRGTTFYFSLPMAPTPGRERKV